MFLDFNLIYTYHHTRPLDLEKVAEIKYASQYIYKEHRCDVFDGRALLPDLIKFAYIPKNEHFINESASSSKSVGEQDQLTRDNATSPRGYLNDEEHVLVLDFSEIKKSGAGKKGEMSGVR